MKFRMVTTFYGPHSFGGDAAYVDRLSRALCRRGHEVHVHYCVDSFNAVRGEHPLRPYEPEPGLRLHPIETGLGILSPLATHLTGRPIFKSETLREHLEEVDNDVVHFHNISLIGGPGVLSLGKNAVRVMTAHEHWLTCPLSLLWKFGRERCERPECVKCCLASGRPPQLWRYGDAIPRGLSELDALLFPSRHALELHRAAGIGAPMVHLPYFLPDDWTEHLEFEETPSPPRPYFAAAGRFIRMKGFQQLIPLMRHLPDADLRIAGTGPFEVELRRLAEGLPNVRFEGLLGSRQVSRLFQGATAVVVPSLFPETFGYVVLEAFAVRTPVVVNLQGGALHETGVLSGGGLGYSDDSELLLHLRRLVHDEDLREATAARGYKMRVTEWSETAHLDRYFGLIDNIRNSRSSIPRPKFLGMDLRPKSRFETK